MRCGACVWLIGWYHVGWCADDSAARPNASLEVIQDLTGRASELAMRAMGLLGIHYKYGGTSPDKGLDCSGLVRYVVKQVSGAELPRTAVEISKVGQRVDANDLQTGDLVFFNTLRRGFSHVGIYLGDHRFIHSPAHGGEVRIEHMDLRYWRRRFNGARRVKDIESTSFASDQNS